MTDPIHHLRTLHNNPFLFAPAFINFFERLGLKEKSFLLSYLVLPLTLSPYSREFLCAANSKSSLRTMLQGRSRIYGLGERVALYREMTNVTVQYLLDTGVFTIHNQLVVAVANHHHANDLSPDGVVKAARRLAAFFEPYDVEMIYRRLGVFTL